MKQKTYIIKTQEKTTLYIGEGVSRNMQKLLKASGHTGYIVLCSPQIKNLYAASVVKSLKKLRVPVVICVIENGEKYKSLETVTSLLDTMLEAGLDRRSAVIALGGGIVGDVATFIAGLYNRGVDCIQIPTTLLAQVDSAYGGKGGVNLGIYKNMIGVIKQPRFVIVDTMFLKSLPDVQIRSGMGEAVKYGIAHDRKFFEYLQHSDPKNIDYKEIIQRCSSIKMSMVTVDPLDVGDKRIALNFGHTLGHAVERLGDLPHGLAVSVGMSFAIKLSVKKGLLKNASGEKALALLKKFSLPLHVENVKQEEILTIMKKDKKAVAGKLRLVLLEDIGKTVVVDDITEEEVKEILLEVIV